MDPTPPLAPEPPPVSRWELGAKGGMVGTIIALTCATLAYQWLHDQQLEETAALYVGLPAFLAILVTLSPTRTSATLIALKAATLFLLLSAIVLREGAICLLMASPLFYGVAGAAGVIIDLARRSARRRPRLVVGLAPFLALSLEGTTDRWSLDRAEAVSVTRVVPGTTEEVRERLGRLPSYGPMPGVLAWFPPPYAVEGDPGLAPGARRVVRFGSRDEPAGALVLEVAVSEPDHVRFGVREDTSPTRSWIGWRSDDVWLSPVGDDRVRVTWSTRYERRLDPAWYWAPIERAAMRRAAATNLETLVGAP